MAVNNKSILIGVLVGVVLCAIGFILLSPQHPGDVSAIDKSNDKKPLYWVAPMDANYKRDKPGNSPMGMALIPVYENDKYGPDEGVGTIRISSNVINNLGVRTTLVQTKALQRKINTVGFVTYDEDKLIHIHPRVAGWIEKLYVKAVGDPVKKGQPIYDIYSPELVNAQDELLLAIERKNQRLIQAAENRLVALQLSSKTINVLKKTRKVQQTITFFSPQNGVVKSLDIREGFFVTPETMMLSIADLSQIWVKAEIFERQAAQVSMGDKVIMKLDYLPNKQWQGHIEHVHPMINTKTRTTVVRLRFDNTSGDLKPNMFAQVSIDTNDKDKTLLIPKEALIRTGNQDRVVLALGQGNFKSIAVKVGRFDPHNVEILSGLTEGEKVVSSAQFLLDSESSKTSDFKRMMANDTLSTMSMENMADNSEMGNSTEVESAMVHGTVNSVMITHRMVNISREAIEKWDRPAGDVDFIIAENVDISLFTKGAYLMFTFEIHNGDFIIVNAMAMPKSKPMKMPGSMNKPLSIKAEEHQGAH